MPVANKKNLMLDRPTSHGGWPGGPNDWWGGNKSVSDTIYDYLKDMGLVAESDLRKLISEIILDIENSPRLSECVVAAGQTQGQNVLAKTRDRNYKPEVKIIRELLDDGTEIVYMIDLKTGFLEGMNNHGVGILNSTLMVYEDENPLEHGTQKDYGKIIKKALKSKNSEKAVEILCNSGEGVEGHTFVGCPDFLHSVERTKHHDSIVSRLNPLSNFEVRTNHGNYYPSAGYTEKEKPDDYLSSKIRKATVELSLSGINDYSQIARSLLSRKFNKDSNKNTLRRTNNLRTTSQITMNLPKREFLFYVFPSECKFLGLEDLTPVDHQPSIKIRMFNWKGD
tara:strand:+ start:77845 stop:78858 length:1014 start_codon:yes stop_codon:yes gene_type:complete